MNESVGEWMVEWMNEWNKLLTTSEELELSTLENKETVFLRSFSSYSFLLFLSFFFRDFNKYIFLSFFSF